MSAIASDPFNPQSHTTLPSHMKHRSISVLALIVSLISLLAGPSDAAPPSNKLSISVRTVDPKSDEPKTTFAPGDKVKLLITVTGLPEVGSGKRASLSIRPELKIDGIKVPYAFNFSLSGSNTNPFGLPKAPKQSPGKGPFVLPLLASGEEARTFTIPSGIPDSQLSTIVTVQFDHRNASATARILIRNSTSN